MHLQYTDEQNLKPSWKATYTHKIVHFLLKQEKREYMSPVPIYT